jgi:glycosyltransferase involved in cell wall biosynthesis
MRVLYVSYPLSDRQAPHQSMGALWLARNGIEVTLLAWGGDAGAPSWLPEYPSLRYRAIPKNGWLSAFAFLLAVVRETWRVKPDCVYVQGAQHTPFALWLGVVSGGATVVYHTQDYLGPGQHRLYEAAERMFARHADAVICNEPNRARFLASSYGLREMPRVIRTALPTWWPVAKRDPGRRARLLAEAHVDGFGDGARLVAVGGAYDPGRMSKQLVEAFATLPANYALVFTSTPPGSPGRRLAEAQLASIGLARRVAFLGALDYAELLAVYAACDIGILLYPNTGIGHYYQAPGRLTEYLRCGLPVVASRFPGLELLVRTHEIGATADPYDAGSIAAAIRAVGDREDADMERQRRRMIAVGESELAYDVDASSVYPGILPRMLPCR